MHKVLFSHPVQHLVDSNHERENHENTRQIKSNITTLQLYLLLIINQPFYVESVFFRVSFRGGSIRGTGMSQIRFLVQRTFLLIGLCISIFTPKFPDNSYD